MWDAVPAHRAALLLLLLCTLTPSLALLVDLLLLTHARLHAYMITTVINSQKEGTRRRHGWAWGRS